MIKTFTNMFLSLLFVFIVGLANSNSKEDTSCTHGPKCHCQACSRVFGTSHS